jgi:toxin ParE1/3/4
VASKQRTLRPRAREDILDIWQFIALDNETAATKLVHRFDRAVQMLADNPHAGRERPDLAEGIRSFPVGRYVIFYQPTGNGIDVVRILHGSRDIMPDDVGTAD